MLAKPFGRTSKSHAEGCVLGGLDRVDDGSEPDREEDREASPEGNCLCHIIAL